MTEPKSERGRMTAEEARFIADAANRKISQVGEGLTDEEAKTLLEDYRASREEEDE